MQVEHYTWDRQSGSFLSDGETAPPKDQRPDGLDMPKAPRQKRFLKGPVPWQWLIQAARLPGQALVVGLCLWRLKGATNQEAVWLSNSELDPFGVDRSAKSRAIAVLEKAGLISVERKRGHRLVMRLLQT